MYHRTFQPNQLWQERKEGREGCKQRCNITSLFQKPSSLLWAKHSTHCKSFPLLLQANGLGGRCWNLMPDVLRISVLRILVADPWVRSTNSLLDLKTGLIISRYCQLWNLSSESARVPKRDRVEIIIAERFCKCTCWLFPLLLTSQLKYQASRAVAKSRSPLQIIANGCLLSSRGNPTM